MLLLLLKPSTLVLLVITFLVTAKTLMSRRRRKSCPLPPGPPGEPILGHLRVIPASSQEFAFMRWSKAYASDILSFNVLGKSIIVLNSVQAANDLLDKRGANYINRPRLAYLEAMGWVKIFGFMSDGPEFRMQRPVAQRHFKNSNIGPYRHLQQSEAVVILKGLLARPAEWHSVFSRFALAIALGVVFGIKIKSDSDRFIKIAEDVSYVFSKGGAPGATLVDFFPFLRWMPSCFHDKTLKFAREWSFVSTNLREETFAAMRASDERTKCFVQDLMDHRQNQIEEGQKPDMSDDDMKGAGAGMFSAALDTSWASLVVFMLGMVLHPEIQVKAQRLIDQVVGRERLPSFEDRPKLQYIDHIVQETLRWYPVVPLGIPHCPIKDDFYKGYFIPRGSIVMANARAMTHDETVYTNADVFDPDRYIPIEKGGRGEPFPIGPFGFGRRVCVGKYLAEASLWIAMASILSTMEIEKARDEDGNEITPVIENLSGLVCHPKLFPCRIEPRDSKSIEVIQKA